MNKYLEKIEHRAGLEKVAVDPLSLAAATAGGHIAQNVATRVRMHQPGFWDRVGHSYQRGLAHLPETDVAHNPKKLAKGTKHKRHADRILQDEEKLGKGSWFSPGTRNFFGNNKTMMNAYSGALVPEEGIMNAHAHHAGKEFLGEIGPNGPTRAQKKALVTLRLAGRGEFQKIHRRGLHKLPEIERALEKANPDVAKKVKNSHLFDARLAERVYKANEETPVVQAMQSHAKKQRREIEATAGKKGGNIQHQMLPSIGGLATVEPGMAALSGLKMGLASETAGKIAPVKKTRDWLTNTFYKGPARRGAIAGKQGKEIPKWEYNVKSTFLNPVASDLERLSNQWGKAHKDEIAQVERGKARHSEMKARWAAEDNKAHYENYTRPMAKRKADLAVETSRRKFRQMKAKQEAEGKSARPVQRVVENRAAQPQPAAQPAVVHKPATPGTGHAGTTHPNRPVQKSVEKSTKDRNVNAAIAGMGATGLAGGAYAYRQHRRSLKEGAY